jgi:two-component system, OmpR family, phosphate regulon response regulator PhoB
MAATQPCKQILIVDRDVAAVEPLRQKLTDAGFAVRAIADGGAALAAVVDRPPHLVLVDWSMPGTLPLEWIQGVRRASVPQPVRLIILSALSGEQEVVTGLNLGADDFIAKPYSLREVVARVCAVLRAHAPEERRPALCCDELELDTATHRVTARGAMLTLSGIEYRLLEFLMLHAGRAFNRHQLLAHVWGDDRALDAHTVDVNVQRLRKTLSEPGYAAYIQTVRGFGYRFAVPTAPRWNGY